MNCFKEDKIQQYIDGECTADEAARIKRHLAECSDCAAKVEHQGKTAVGLKNAINLLVDEPGEIPVFVAPVIPLKKTFIRSGKFIYSLLAACVIIFALVFIYEKENKSEEQITLIMSVGPEVDANLPLTDQEIQINIIDPEGNMKELSLK